ncbi:MAG: hypothetical protein ACRYF2_24170 [Janthinobacterium lividum]
MAWDVLSRIAGDAYVPPAILKQLKGDRAFVELLLMARDAGLETLEVACELVLDGNVVTAPVVINEMRRLLQGSTNAARTAAVSASSPAANVATAPMPHARASACQVSNPATGAAGMAPCCRRRRLQARIKAVNRRARPVATAACPSCSTRLTTAPAVASSAVTIHAKRG